MSHCKWIIIFCVVWGNGFNTVILITLIKWLTGLTCRHCCHHHHHHHEYTCMRLWHAHKIDTESHCFWAGSGWGIILHDSIRITVFHIRLDTYRSSKHIWCYHHYRSLRVRAFLVFTAGFKRL
jgi:hypothetical protein